MPEDTAKVPEPALVRAGVVAVFGLASFVLGRQFDLAWVDPALVLYSFIAPAVLGWWIRRHVSPAKT